MLVKTMSTSSQAGKDPARDADASWADAGDGAGAADLSGEERGAGSGVLSRLPASAASSGGRAPLIASTALCALQPCSPDRGIRAAAADAAESSTMLASGLGIPPTPSRQEKSRVNKTANPFVPSFLAIKRS
jgi:hypothetical protein